MDEQQDGCLSGRTYFLSEKEKPSETRNISPRFHDAHVRPFFFEPWKMLYNESRHTVWDMCVVKGPVDAQFRIYLDQ